MLYYTMIEFFFKLLYLKRAEKGDISVIKIENYKGNIAITEEFFSSLIGTAARECYGVAGMAVGGARQSINKLLKREKTDHGVKVKVTSEGLDIELHIVVTYGVNISAIVKSIVHKVKYVVEDATDMKVARINVFVDSMIA